MDDQQRDELRERNRRRGYTCRRCGAPSISYREGKATDTDLFPGVWYKVCGACGYIWMLKNKPK